MSVINEHVALPLKQFTFDRSKGTLTAMASDFGPLHEGLWWLVQLYNDSCDVGISIMSGITGRIERFYLQQQEEREGDLVAWHFKPISKLANVQSVTIYND
jgi:hypothetical protein